jgi:hypothetical protein
MDSEKITVTILDTATQARVQDSDASFFWWADGNGSCDCNRELLFGNETEGNTCIGSQRYLIVGVNTDDNLRDLNAHYPDSLLQQYSIT